MVCALVCLSLPASAEDWRAVQVSGLVEQRAPDDSDDQWRPVAPGTPLLVSAKIRTGANGRMTAARGVSVMEFSPNSQAELREIEPTGLRTTIFQTLGRVLFRVEKQNVRHFEVRTPYLVTAVKGTVFSVDVSAAGASVSVSEDVVGVSRGGGAAAPDAVDVAPGQIATTSAAPGSAISVTTEGAPAPATPSKGLTGSTQGLAAAPALTAGPIPDEARRAHRVAVRVRAKAVAKVQVREQDRERDKVLVRAKVKGPARVKARVKARAPAR